MKQSTCEFPMFDLTKAIQDVKADDPSNELLQNCRLPSSIGGEVDCLMGTMNVVIHPVPIHTMMETGLCIYESKLMSHD